MNFAAYKCWDHFGYLYHSLISVRSKNISTFPTTTNSNTDDTIIMAFSNYLSDVINGLQNLYVTKDNNQGEASANINTVDKAADIMQAIGMPRPDPVGVDEYMKNKYPFLREPAPEPEQEIKESSLPKFDLPKEPSTPDEIVYLNVEEPEEEPEPEVQQVPGVVSVPEGGVFAVLPNDHYIFQMNPNLPQWPIPQHLVGNFVVGQAVDVQEVLDMIQDEDEDFEEDFESDDSGIESDIGEEDAEE